MRPADLIRPVAAGERSTDGVTRARVGVPLLEWAAGPSVGLGSDAFSCSTGHATEIESFDIDWGSITTQFYFNLLKQQMYYTATARPVITAKLNTDDSALACTVKVGKLAKIKVPIPTTPPLTAELSPVISLSAEKNSSVKAKFTPSFTAGFHVESSNIRPIGSVNGGSDVQAGSESSVKVSTGFKVGIKLAGRAGVTGQVDVNAKISWPRRCLEVNLSASVTFGVEADVWISQWSYTLSPYETPLWRVLRRCGGATSSSSTSPPTSTTTSPPSSSTPPTTTAPPPGPADVNGQITTSGNVFTTAVTNRSASPIDCYTFPIGLVGTDPARPIPFPTSPMPTTIQAGSQASYSSRGPDGQYQLAWICLSRTEPATEWGSWPKESSGRPLTNENVPYHQVGEPLSVKFKAEDVQANITVAGNTVTLSVVNKTETPIACALAVNGESHAFGGNWQTVAEHTSAEISRDGPDGKYGADWICDNREAVGSTSGLVATWSSMPPYDNRYPMYPWHKIGETVFITLPCPSSSSLCGEGEVQPS